MTVVDRVKAICDERNIPIYKFESDLGFSNGYIRKLKKGTIPIDRLEKIADYLGLPFEYLMTGEMNDPYSDKDAELVGILRRDEKLRSALMSLNKLSPKNKDYVIELIHILSEGENK